MLSIDEAKKKIRQIDPGTPAATQLLIEHILERKLELTPANSDDTRDLQAVTHWIENRLAQKHLGYLSPDQVNGVWGGSLTQALSELGKRYNLGIDKAHPKIGSDFMRAILDGTLAKTEPVPAANTYDWLKYQVEHAQYPEFNKTHAGRVWRSGKMEMNVVGIRGYMVPEGVVPNYGNLWNDTIFIAWIDNSGNKQCKAWAASTDPGRYYYHTKPINPQGTAHLVPGQYAYVKGWHQSPANVAFNQAGTKAGNVLCYRADAPTIDLNDGTRVTEDSPNARYWINIHAGFQWSATQGVEWSSAGCQVIKAAGWTDWRWKTFRDTLLNNAGGFFWYTLLDSRSLKGQKQ